MTSDQQPFNSPDNLTQRLNIDLALEAAGLGIWEFDLATGGINWDERCGALYGFTQGFQIAYEKFIECVHPDDVVLLGEELQRLSTLDSHGRYDVTYRVNTIQDGRLRWIRSYGQATFAKSGELIRFAGVAQDVTQQVKEHTQELESTNEELAATNEQLTVINEEMLASNNALERANSDLLRSNENLEQFAYIASHDLQEPLRKIQQFSDLLKKQYRADPDGEEWAYLERMQNAASRMSLLIKDLLTFSRISTSQVLARPLPLNEVISQVIEDLSVAIEESGAQIQVGFLPMVQGDRTQLSQLFQNLLSNAVKFRHRAMSGQVVRPQISVRASLVFRDELPVLLQVPPSAEVYHRIEVADNGVGFDEKYADRIFQVFQRLHGKNEFAGTGIGLAVVQKIVTNHGGAITASSQPGQGATFSVYLPV
ncbi:sensor histidine kinase [Spirosoma pollinicola]|uniref:histidine kinase n=1 Tax=Spirosoma pollinicola TaxID=2057025 RepID=A0A2K8ZAZ4_9BACT|nr:ATP-binding protein [Spirosoma pollinicola]AUD07014.1 PAS domain-containing sensor histidine kinase [Spirosoma pollinicola]